MFGWLARLAHAAALPRLGDPAPERMAANPLPEDAFAELLSLAKRSRGHREGRGVGRRTWQEYQRSHWELALSTDPWFLLVDQRAPTVAGMPPPLVVASGPARMVLFHSSQERAVAATRRLGLLESHGAVGVLRMPRDNACNWVAGFEGADAVAFNADETRWLAWLRIRDLVVAFERRFDRLLPRMNGRFGEAVNRGGRPLRSRLVRRLMSLTEWWFVATSSKADAPLVLSTRRGLLALPCFSDAERARRGGHAIVAALGEGAAVFLPTEPRRGLSFLRRLQERERPTHVALLLDDVRGDVGEPAALPLDEVVAAGDALGW